jgi:hypothetical protein
MYIWAERDGERKLEKKYAKANMIGLKRIGAQSRVDACYVIGNDKLATGITTLVEKR